MKKRFVLFLAILLTAFVSTPAFAEPPSPTQMVEFWQLADKGSVTDANLEAFLAAHRTPNDSAPSVRLSDLEKTKLNQYLGAGGHLELDFDSPSSAHRSTKPTKTQLDELRQLAQEGKIAFSEVASLLELYGRYYSGKLTFADLEAFLAAHRTTKAEVSVASAKPTKAQLDELLQLFEDGKILLYDPEFSPDLFVRFYSGTLTYAEAEAILAAHRSPKMGEPAPTNVRK